MLQKVSSALGRSQVRDESTSGRKDFFRIPFSGKSKGPNPRTRLPTELILYIFSFLPPDVKLYPILFVGPGFCAEVERRLYIHIDLTGDCIGQDSPSKAQPNPERFGHRHIRRRISLFKMLSRTPRLSCMVQSIVLPPSKFMGEMRRWDNPVMQQLYSRLLNLALRAMPHLKNLTLGMFSTHHMRNEIFGVGREVIGREAEHWFAIFDGCSFHDCRLHVGLYDQGEPIIPVVPGLTWEMDHSTTHRSSTIVEVVYYTPLLEAPRRIRAVHSMEVHSPTRTLWPPKTKTYSELHSLRFSTSGSSGDFLSVGLFQTAHCFPALAFLRIDYPPGWARLPFFRMDYSPRWVRLPFTSPDVSLT